MAFRPSVGRSVVRAPLGQKPQEGDVAVPAKVNGMEKPVLHAALRRPPVRPLSIFHRNLLIPTNGIGWASFVRPPPPPIPSSHHCHCLRRRSVRSGPAGDIEHVSLVPSFVSPSSVELGVHCSCISRCRGKKRATPENFEGQFRRIRWRRGRT